MTQPIGNFLKSYTKGEDQNPHIGRAHLLSVFRERAKQLIPKDMHLDFSPKHIKNGTLTVACSSSGVAFKLQNHEDELLKDLLDEAGVEVTKIRTLLTIMK